MTIEEQGGFNTLDAKGEVTKTYEQKNQIDTKVLVALDNDVVLLVDGDIIAYRGAATADGREYSVTREAEVSTFKYKKEAVAYCKKHSMELREITLKYLAEPESNATFNVKRSMKKLLEAFKGIGEAGLKLSMETYLTPKVTFRNDVKSDYKANRKNIRRPTHLAASKRYLKSRYGATIREGYEADDLLCIRATELLSQGKTPVICSIDKDLDQMSCFHYSWTKDSLYFIRPEEGLKLLYSQLLTGDATDNIPGLKGVGPKTAEKILKDCDGHSELDLYLTVLKEYLNRTPRLVDDTDVALESDKEYASRILKVSTQNMRLLYLCREYEDLWSPPVASAGNTK